MTNNTVIKIVNCSDPLLWYKGKIGEYFPLLKQYDDCFLTREPAGFTNIIRLQDGELVDASKVEEDNKMSPKQQEVLDLIQEECAELIQAISKVRRFGKKDNMNQLCTELADIKGLTSLAHDLIPELQAFDWDTAIEKKVAKLQIYSGLFK